MRAEPYAYGEARALTPTTWGSPSRSRSRSSAAATARRAARAFLDAEETHARAFEVMDALVASRAAIAAGKRITVHGDYDVDGVCSTSIMVAALRRAGADCDWLIPDRLGDGYGLSAGSWSTSASGGPGAGHGRLRDRRGRARRWRGTGSR